MDIKTFKQEFDPLLDGLIKRYIEQASSCIGDVFVRDLVSYAQALSAAGGKRVRPYIACLTYGLSGGTERSAAMELFAGLELFHLFALIHDDIMDQGVERHGIATSHRFIEQTLSKEKRRGDFKRVGEAQAILLGDLLHAWSQTQMRVSAAPFDPKHAANMQHEFATMVDEVILGQMLDVDSMTRTSVDGSLINDKMRLKTASYTFIRPMRMGAALAGASASTLTFCDVYGLALGFAFQIQDDLLDLSASSADIHKTVFSDLREHQHTLFTQFIREQGTDEQQKELNELLGHELTESDRLRVQKLFQSSGAFDHGRQKMQTYFDSAQAALDQLTLSDDKKQPFADLIQYIRQRSH